jgi:hypothetical protein
MSNLGRAARAGLVGVKVPALLAGPILLTAALTGFAIGRAFDQPSEEAVLLQGILTTGAGQPLCCGPNAVVKEHAPAALLWILGGPDVLFCRIHDVAYVRRFNETCRGNTRPRVVIRTLAVGIDTEPVQHFARRYRVPGSVTVVRSGILLTGAHLSGPTLALVDSNSTLLWLAGPADRVANALNLVALTQVLGFCGLQGTADGMRRDGHRFVGTYRDEEAGRDKLASPGGGE